MSVTARRGRDQRPVPTPRHATLASRSVQSLLSRAIPRFPDGCRDAKENTDPASQPVRSLAGVVLELEIVSEGLPWIIDIALLALVVTWRIRSARRRVREAAEVIGPAYLEITPKGTILHRVAMGQPMFQVRVGIGQSIVVWGCCLILAAAMGLIGYVAWNPLQNMVHLDAASNASQAHWLGLIALFSLLPFLLAWWIQSQRLEVFERGLIRGSWFGDRRAFWFIELGGLSYVPPIEGNPGQLRLRSAADPDQPAVVWSISRVDSRLNDLIEWLMEQTYQRMVEQFRRNGRADWTDWLQFRSDGLAVWKPPSRSFRAGWGDCRTQPPRVIAYDHIRLQERGWRGDWEILEVPSTTTAPRSGQSKSRSRDGERVCVLPTWLENLHPALVFLQKRIDGEPLEESESPLDSLENAGDPLATDADTNRDDIG